MSSLHYVSKTGNKFEFLVDITQVHQTMFDLYKRYSVVGTSLIDHKNNRVYNIEEAKAINGTKFMPWPDVLHGPVLWPMPDRVRHILYEFKCSPSDQPITDFKGS